MKLFSKKSKQTTETKTEIIHLDLDDFPSKALELTYMDLMERYDKQPTDRLQKIMVQFSRELTSRSTDHVEPPKVQLSIKVEPKPEPKPESNYEGLVRKRIEKITKKPEQIPGMDKREVIKKFHEHEKTLANVEPEILAESEKSVQDHMIKKFKPKKSIGSFFKKKVRVQKSSGAKIATTLQDQMNIQEDANKIIQLEDKPKKLSIPFNLPITQLVKKKGYNLKGIELICECGHYLKAHQKGGVSVGCQKCGCLKPIQAIAKRHGIILKLKDQSQKEELTINKQVKQIQTMTQKETPKITTKEKQMFEAAEEQKEEPCTCDHKASEHYEGQFCYVCNCSKYSPYPTQVKEIEQVKKETPK